MTLWAWDTHLRRGCWPGTTGVSWGGGYNLTGSYSVDKSARWFQWWLLGKTIIISKRSEARITPKGGLPGKKWHNLMCVLR